MDLQSSSSILSLDSLVTLTVNLILLTHTRPVLMESMNHLTIAVGKDVVTVNMIVFEPKNIKPGRNLLKQQLQLLKLSNYPLLDGFCQ